MTDEQAALERASADRSGADTGSADGRTTTPTLRDAAMHWAERLREVTVKAPLQSLLVAFLVGIWFARRR
ncbi:hypothetical protein [Bradyrhizobium sp. CCBAU 51627]|uniref:hypothetical protein n=1 Tax=Bradyrhizobium sp. CCBAU 51627 TaxID=1325088 RepID=UPI0023061DF3|nr:hypothetical protein [Bradyrhizobium sp. CCBAU 51627]